MISISFFRFFFFFFFLLSRCLLQMYTIPAGGKRKTAISTFILLWEITLELLLLHVSCHGCCYCIGHYKSFTHDIGRRQTPIYSYCLLLARSSSVCHLMISRPSTNSFSSIVSFFFFFSFFIIIREGTSKNHFGASRSSSAPTRRAEGKIRPKSNTLYIIKGVGVLPLEQFGIKHHQSASMNIHPPLLLSRL